MDAAQAPAGRHLLRLRPPRRLLPALGDDRLAALVRAGYDDAFGAIYDRHSRGLLAFCRHLLGSREEGEDALQQTMLTAYRELHRSPREIRLKPWLYAVARNHCLSILRARNRELPPDAPPSVDGLAEEAQRRDDLRALVSDMGSLPVDQRAALVLSELDDLSHVEIAEALGCEASKVKSLVYQARNSLIERRRARETPCAEIRERLATGRGGALRRRMLRDHLRSCPGCSEFRDQLRAQRRALALVLPVLPSVALRDSVLGAVGISASAGASGGLAAIAGSQLATGKAAMAALAVTGAAVAGGVALEVERDGRAPGGGPSAGAQERSGAGLGRAERTFRDGGGRGSGIGADHRGNGLNGASPSRRGTRTREGDHRADAPRPSRNASGAGPPQTVPGRSGAAPPSPAAPPPVKSKPPHSVKGSPPATPPRSDSAQGFRPRTGGSNGQAARDFGHSRGEARSGSAAGPSRGTPGDPPSARGHSGQARDAGGGPPTGRGGGREK